MSRLQHHVPVSDEASENKGGKLINVAFLHHDAHQSDSLLLNKDLLNPSQLGLTSEGKFLSEYFGLAMAICAVGLLRNAWPGLEAAFSNRFSKEDAQSKARQRVLTPFEHLVPSSHNEQKCLFEKAEKSLILQKITLLQIELSELKRLRSEDGKANERVVSIFASKEQDWKLERRKLKEEQHKLYQELQRAFLQQEALRSQMDDLRSLQKQPCAECVRREGLSVELKKRLGEQEFLIMATMEEVQIERQEKDAIAEKLAAVESSVSQLQSKLSANAEQHVLELTMHKDLMKQLETRAEHAENDYFQILQEFNASQASLSAVIHEKNHCKDLVSDMSKEINQLKTCVQKKDTTISALLKKANADAEDRKELENELGLMKAKLDHAEKEKQKWRRLVQMSARSSLENETLKSRSRCSSESRSVPVARNMIEDLEKLHDAELKSLQTVYEEQVKMLQKRLSMYQERIADLEEDILSSMTDTRQMFRYDEHLSLTNGDMDNNCLAALHECLEAELASKEFQLSVAKSSIKQFMDSEVYREQEVERWKELYLASKTAIGLHKEKEHTGAVVSSSPNLRDWLELEKSRHCYKLEKRHRQEIDAFERHMRARDERMEAFRRQLLHMGDEAQRARCQIESLKQSLETSYEDGSRLEEILKQKEAELAACQEKVAVTYTSCTCDKNLKEEICNLQEKVTTLQTMLLGREIESELSLAKASSQAECELEDAECKLAVAEAQLVQAHIIHEEERKEKGKLLLEWHREKIAWELSLNTVLAFTAQQGKILKQPYRGIQ